MMISCAPADRDRVMPILAKMTGKVIDLGDDPIRAAAFKLFGNMFIVTTKRYPLKLHREQVGRAQRGATSQLGRDPTSD